MFKDWVNIGWNTVPQDPGRSWEKNMVEPLKAFTRGVRLRTLHFMPVNGQNIDLDIIQYCRHKMNNFPKFSFYACNIELDAYGRLY